MRAARSSLVPIVAAALLLLGCAQASAPTAPPHSLAPESSATPAPSESPETSAETGLDWNSPEVCTALSSHFAPLVAEMPTFAVERQLFGPEAPHCVFSSSSQGEDGGRFDYVDGLYFFDTDTEAQAAADSHRARLEGLGFTEENVAMQPGTWAFYMYLTADMDVNFIIEGFTETNFALTYFLDTDDDIHPDEIPPGLLINFRQRIGSTGG